MASAAAANAPVEDRVRAAVLASPGGFPAHVVRAAVEGYNVWEAAEAALAEAAKMAILDCHPQTPLEAAPEEVGYGWKVAQRCPTPRAFETLDAIKAASPNIEALCPGLRLEIGGLGQVDVAPEGRAIWVGAVDSKIRWGVTGDCVLGLRVLTENVPERDEDEED
jgi:hypothetical protein